MGLHHPYQGGIDYMEENGIKFATSIVKSGRYGNDAGESPNVVIYSGQGGNPNIVDKPPEDQKLTRGNLALKNSMDAGLPEKPVRAVNIEDDEKLPPFHYVTNVIYPEWYESTHSVPRGCDCINGCLGFEKCPCTVAYGGDIPFTSEDASLGESLSFTSVAHLANARLLAKIGLANRNSVPFGDF
ncbi:hypothetical protein C3L33_03035, partial [Rhododendron williamsianum]